MNEPEISVLRFWSPLTAAVYRHSVDYEQGFPPDYFTDRELVNHQAAIQAAIDDGWTESERQHGLWNRLNGFQLRERITDIHLSVKEYSGRLWAVAGVKAFSPLSKLEQNAVAGFLEMQYKEGWGCRFNQKAIPIEGNMELYIGFWSPVAFSIRSESEFMAGLVSSREDTLCFRDATASNQLSIWSVLSARFYYPPTDVWPDWESEWPENDEIVCYKDQINQMLSGLDLNQYLEGNIAGGKVVSIHLSTEPWAPSNGGRVELWGVATIETTCELNADEARELIDSLYQQYHDGWGAGFAEYTFSVDKDKTLQLLFGDDVDNYLILPESEFKERQNQIQMENSMRWNGCHLQ